MTDKAVQAFIEKKIAQVDWSKSDLHGEARVNWAYSNERNDGYYGVCIDAGMNGSGKWSDYMSSVADLLSKIEEDIPDVVVSDLWTDFIDDVFSVTLDFPLDKLAAL